MVGFNVFLGEVDATALSTVILRFLFHLDAMLNPSMKWIDGRVRSSLPVNMLRFSARQKSKAYAILQRYIGYAATARVHWTAILASKRVFNFFHHLVTSQKHGRREVEKAGRSFRSATRQ